MASTVMIVHCNKCGAEAVVRGVDTGPDRSPEPGVGRDDHDTSGSLQVIDCPNCGTHTQAMTPQGS
jgi:predicted RNA-binding Zn-ribbon protein involved in translation (DUF1610 family)